LWDARSGAEVLTLRGHRSTVDSVTFSPDGSRVGSLGFDGTFRVWELDLDRLIALAERELTRTFTEEECRQYLHLDRCPQPSGRPASVQTMITSSHVTS
jgi:WD40 repeat protein